MSLQEFFQHIRSTIDMYQSNISVPSDKNFYDDLVDKTGQCSIYDINEQLRDIKCRIEHSMITNVNSMKKEWHFTVIDETNPSFEGATRVLVPKKFWLLEAE